MLLFTEEERNMKRRLFIPVLALAAAVSFAAPSSFMKGAPVVTAQADNADTYTVKVSSGYLALRTAKAFDASNEIGKLYTGDTVQVYDKDDATYWYVYSPKHNKYGYVNRNYLTGGPDMTKNVEGSTFSVKVSSGYLALRNAKAFDASNEIGKLYTGDQVILQDPSDDTYWYVYSPKYGKYGYVNMKYLDGAALAPTRIIDVYKVSVSEGYLALRTAKAYDSSNEIGKLYTGDEFHVTDNSGDTYWYGYSPKNGRYGYVNRNYLVGASKPAPEPSYDPEPSNVIGTYSVRVADGYLALRTAKAFDYSNEIGKLWTGDTVEVTDNSDSTYWWVYAPSLGKSGYVNRNYLVGAGSSAPSSSSWTMTVSVSDGYLALRTAKAFDYNNEIGKLWSGDTVEVQDSSDSTYWWVYAPSLGRSGYVNRNYLY